MKSFSCIAAALCTLFVFHSSHASFFDTIVNPLESDASHQAVSRLQKWEQKRIAFLENGNKQKALSIYNNQTNLIHSLAYQKLIPIVYKKINELSDNEIREHWYNRTQILPNSGLWQGENLRLDSLMPLPAYQDYIEKIMRFALADAIDQKQIRVRRYSCFF